MSDLEERLPWRYRPEPLRLRAIILASILFNVAFWALVWEIATW